ncbi:MAG: hypothetical protein IJE44_00280, partial [Clostridia bacterium]|nr:hypothetical protein [Clostridia bacterium]
MTKRILALVLALTMVVSLTTVMVAGAAGGAGGGGGIVLEPAGVVKTLVFPANILVKEAGAEEYDADDSITITERTVGSIPAFDFKAYVDTALLLANINEQLDGDSSLLDDEVTGSVVLTLEIPATVTVDPEKVVVATNDLFTYEKELVGNELKVTLSVVEENNTVADLKAAVETSIVEITCTDVEVSAFGTYEITGSADGALDIGGLLTVECVLDGIGEDSIAATVTASKTTSGGGSVD